MSHREIFLVLLSALLHAVWNTSTKGSRSPLGFAVLIDAFALVGLLLVLPWFELSDIPREVWIILVLSGAIHALYFYWLCRAYESGDLSLVYPIARSAPAFLPLLAIPLLGDQVSARGALGIAVVVAGIWLVYSEGWRWRSLRTPGVGFALLTLTASLCYSILDKRGMTTLSEATWSGLAPRALVFYFIMETLTFIGFLPLALRRIGASGVRDVARTELRGALGASIAAFASYALILEAFRTAPVSYVVAARQLSVLFAVGLSAVWLRERPSRLRLLGVAATVAGVVLVAGG